MPDSRSSRNYAPPPDSVRGRMGELLMQGIGFLGGVTGLPMSAPNDRAALIGELLAAGMPLVGGLKAIKAAKTASAVNAPLPHMARQPITLYHGSPENNPFTVQDNKGLFDGVFASRDQQVANSHGNNLYQFDVPKDLILTDYDLKYNPDIKAWETLKELFPRATSKELDELWDVVIENRLPEGPMVLGKDPAEASWEGQRLRGKIAQRAGFKAVETPDEHGISYLVLPGATNKPVK